MRIQHNIMAMSAYRNYTNNVSAMQKNLEKLSSGYKINRAGDDAAGLAISEKMRAQITGLETAQKNAKDGISLVQTAEGALTEVHDMLNRMVELATQSANGTYDDTTDRYQLQKEMNQLREEINRIADSSNFNGIQLLDGSMSLNETSPITVDVTGTDAGEAAVTYAAATTVFGTIADPPSTPGSTGDTVLHADAPSAAMGQFTIALDQMSLGGVAATATGKVNLTVGSATVALTAANAGQGMNGQGLAAALASKGKYFTVSATGGTAFAATNTAAALGNNKLVYQASAQGDGTVTYTLVGYTTGSGTLTAIADTDALAGLSSTVTGALTTAAGKDLNMTVSASASVGTLTDNRQNYGTINVTNSQFQGDKAFGNAQVTFNASALASADNVEITIGTGSDAVTLKFKLTENGEDSDVDLTNVDAADYARMIANAFDEKTAASDGIGIHVGVNGSGAITLTEITDGAGNSLAATSIQEAMGSVGTFNSLLSVKIGQLADGAEATSKTTLTVDANSIYEGNSAKITVDGETTEYVFTSDESKLNATDVPAGTKYVALGSDVVKNLAAAIADVTGAPAAVSTSNANQIVISGSGDDIVNVSATVGWTGNMGLTLQIGDTAASYNQLNVNIEDCHTYAMGDGTTSIADISIATQKDAQDALDVIKAAVNYVSNVRGTLGATQNRLEHTINNLSVMTENIQDAESTIRDTDVAEEMMAYTKNNILIQSAQAMLAQANQVPQGVLQLLQ